LVKLAEMKDSITGSVSNVDLPADNQWAIKQPDKLAMRAKN
jgi:hypothetical protein